jgi:hypothetical protein
MKLLYRGFQWKELLIEKDETGHPEIHYTLKAHFQFYLTSAITMTNLYQAHQSHAQSF